MKYKLTLLKDIPEVKAGKVIKGLTEEILKEHWKWANFTEIDHAVMNLADNPEWVKKEIDIDAANICSCPNCNGNKVFPISKSSSKYDDGVKYYYSTVVLECAACGTKYDLFTFLTHSKVEHF